MSGTHVSHGFTTSVNFPVVNALQGTAAARGLPQLTGRPHLCLRTYFGGGQTDSALELLSTRSGLAYVAGYTTGGIFVQARSRRPSAAAR